MHFLSPVVPETRPPPALARPHPPMRRKTPGARPGRPRPASRPLRSRVETGWTISSRRLASARSQGAGGRSALSLSWSCFAIFSLSGYSFCALGSSHPRTSSLLSSSLCYTHEVKSEIACRRASKRVRRSTKQAWPSAPLSAQMTVLLPLGIVSALPFGIP